MKKILTTLLIALSITSISSCDEDVTSSLIEETSINSNTQNGSIVNGRLYFKSEDDFKSYYSKLDSKNLEQISNELDSKLYSKDFNSLVPYFTEYTSPDVIKEFTETSLNSITSTSLTNEDILDHFDDMEDVIGDDLFAAFLNNNSEIQISNEIYKYTDQGLFIARTDKYAELSVIMDDYNVHSLNDIYNIQKIEEPLSYNPDGGLVQLEDGISHYINYLIQPSEGGGDGGGGGYSGGSNPGTSTGNAPENLETIAKNLAECNLKSPLLGNIFGISKVCTNEYENRKRVKIKYYKVDLKLAYIIGIKVKNQKKAGIWFNEKAEKLALGINSLSWGYDHTSDFTKVREQKLSGIVTYFINDITAGGNNPYRVSGKQIFRDNGYGQISHIGAYYSPKLPFEKRLKLDAVMEIAIDNKIVKNEEEARNIFYNFIFDKTKSLFNSLNNKHLNRIGVVIATPKARWIQLYDFSNTCTDCKTIEHVFDWGIMSPKFTYNFGTGSGPNPLNIDWSGDFNSPDILGINAYGMVKKSDKWYGNKFIFNEDK